MALGKGTRSEDRRKEGRKELKQEDRNKGRKEGSRKSIEFCSYSFFTKEFTLNSGSTTRSALVH